MRDLKAFDRFYRQEYTTFMQETEAVRKHNRRCDILSFVLAFAICLPVWAGLFLWGKYYSAPWYALLAGWIVLIFFIILKRTFYFKWYKQLPELHGDQVIGGLVKFISPKLEVSPRNYLSYDDYRRSRLFARYVDDYQGAYCVHGRMGRTDIRFSQIYAGKWDLGYTYDGEGNMVLENQWERVFRGILFVAEFNKDFRSVVILEPRWQGPAGRTAWWIPQADNELILEDQEFNRFFTAYAADPIEGRYILSPSLMTRIVELRKRAGRAISISFVPPHIFVAMSFPILFMPPDYKSFADYERIRDYYFILSFFAEITTILDLDTRIWSKQYGRSRAMV